VAAVSDVEDGFVHQHGSDVVPGRGQFGERGEEVGGGEYVGGVQEAVSLRRHLLAELREQLQFERLALLLRGQHFLLVLLQLRRDVTLGVLQRLLADVVGRHAAGVGVRHLDVVAVDLVVPDLQARDVRPRDLRRLVAGDPPLALAR
jgi:hypothetical protein